LAAFLPGQDEGTFGEVERWRGSHQGLFKIAKVFFSEWDGWITLVLE